MVIQDELKKHILYFNYTRTFHPVSIDDSVLNTRNHTTATLFFIYLLQHCFPGMELDIYYTLSLYPWFSIYLAMKVTSGSQAHIVCLSCNFEE